MGKGRRVRAARVAADSATATSARAASPATWSDRPGLPTPAAASSAPRWRRSHPCDRLRVIAGERTEARRRLAELDAAVVDQVRRERSAGASWADVGRALGVSRQAARQRFATGLTGHVGRGNG